VDGQGSVDERGHAANAVHPDFRDGEVRLEHRALGARRGRRDRQKIVGYWKL